MNKSIVKKESVALCAAVAGILLSGCSRKSVGIIGGDDGSASVFVTESDEKTNYPSETKTVKAVKIDGYLYYDTDEDRDAGGSLNNMDGSFVKMAEAYEIPQNDGESNFELNGDENSYKHGKTDDTVEILIDGEWEIFKKIYDSEKDVSAYKYIMQVEGQTQYGEAEYIVLSNDINITANDVAKSALSSDSRDNTDIYMVSWEND